jgi:DNA-binding NarL/FixJ family response regulator
MEHSDFVSTFTAPHIRLFIIEDYFLARVAITTALKTFSVIDVVGEADSAEEGLLLLPEVQPDILLLDLGLPGMSGIDMAPIVRKQWPKIKIIILTSHNDEDGLLQAIGTGADAYVLKDVKPSKLFEIIQAVSEGGAWLDPFIASIVFNLLLNSELLSALNGVTEELPASSSRIDQKEIDLLQSIVAGKDMQEIAGFMDVSFMTAKKRIATILKKLPVDDRIQTAIETSKSQHCV